MRRLVDGALRGTSRLRLSQGGVALGELGPESFRIRLRWERPASPVKRFAVKLLRLSLPVNRIVLVFCTFVVVMIRGVAKVIDIGLIDLHKALTVEDRVDDLAGAARALS